MSYYNISLGTVTTVVMLLFASIIVTVLVFVIVAYRRQKLHLRNQKTPQGSCHFSHYWLLHLNIFTADYEEPYDWAVWRLPQTEPAMERCPAYGVLTK